MEVDKPEPKVDPLPVQPPSSALEELKKLAEGTTAAAAGTRTSVENLMYPALVAEMTGAQPIPSVTTEPTTAYPSIVLPPQEAEPGVPVAVEPAPQKQQEQEKPIEDKEWIDTPKGLDDSRFFQLVQAYRDSETALGALSGDLGEMTRRAAALSQKDVWKIDAVRSEPEATCSCGQRLSPKAEEYPFARVDKAAVDRLRELLASLRASSGQTLPLRAFEALMAKTRVQLYVDVVLSSSHAMSSVSREEPVIAVVQALQPTQDRDDISHVQHMLSVLFYFERNRPEGILRPGKAEAAEEGTIEAFYADVRKWMLVLGGLVLRRASFEDHVFLLQHLLCCPGVSSWAPCLLQFPAPAAWTAHTAEHFVRVISVFVRPISRSLRPGEVASDLEDWMVVAGSDSAQTRRFQILEEDFMSLFEQLPFGAFCNFLLAHRGAYELGPTPSVLLSELLRILCGALGRLTSYKNFAKLMTRMAMMLLLFSATRTAQQPGSGALYSLGFNVSQHQFDAAFLDTAAAILSVREATIWQFACELPFGAISREAAWQFLGLAHSIPRDRLPRSKDEWFHARDSFQPPPLSSFGDACSTEEGVFLVQALAELARAHGGEIATAVLAVMFHVGVIDRRSRALVFKSVCGLMSAVCEAHIEMVSQIIELIDQRLDSGGIHKQAAAHFLGSMPLARWAPTNGDITSISAWLTGDLDGPKLAAARRVIENLNWFPGGLDISVHRRFAFALLRAWRHHAAAYSNSSVFSLAAKNAYYEFVNWCWDRLLALQYYGLSQRPPDADDKEIVEAAAKHIDGIFSGQTAQKATQPHQLFAALMLTPFGIDPHAWIGTSQPAVTLLKHLIFHQKESAVASVLQQALPLVAERVSPTPGSFQAIVTPAFVGVIRDMLQRPEQSFLPLPLWWARAAGNAGQLLSSIISSHMSDVPAHLAAPLAECWMRTGTGAPTWLRDATSQKIASTVLESWFAFRSQEIPPRQLDGVLHASLPKSETNVSVLPPKPVVSGWFGQQYASLKEVPMLTYQLLYGETVSDTPRRTKLASAADVPIGSLKLCQWTHYAVALDDFSEVVPLFWQAVVHLFFDFATGLKPFRFSEIQTLATKHLSSIGQKYLATVQADSVSLHGTKQHRSHIARQGRRVLGDFFIAASTAIATATTGIDSPNELLFRLPAEVAGNTLLAHCLNVSPFNDSSGAWTNLVNVAAMKARLCDSLRPGAPPAAAAMPQPSYEDAVRKLTTNYSIQPPEVVHSLPAVLPLPLESGMLSSLAEDIALLEREAGNHGARVAEIDRLDNEYFSLLPALFTNCKEVVRQEVTCRSCGRMSSLALDILRARQDERVLGHMSHNREEAARLVQNKHLDIGLCASMLQIEESTLRLVAAIQDPPRERPSEDMFHLGVNLLYRLIGAWESPNLRMFVPTKNAFERSLSTLTSALVSRSSDVASKFLRAMLTSPGRIPLLSQFFRPSLNSTAFAALLCDTLAVYADAAGDMKPALAPLLERFDVGEWAAAAGPAGSVADRKRVMAALCGAMRTCRGDGRTLSYLLRAFSALVSFEFPAMLEDAVRVLLEFSAGQDLPPDAWVELLQHPISSVAPKAAERLLLLLGASLWNLRVVKGQTLYASWGAYFSHFMALLALFTHSMLPQVSQSPEQAGALLAAALKAYEPWLVFRQELGPPWSGTPPEQEKASALIASLASVVAAVQPVVGPAAMDAAWEFISRTAAVVCKFAVERSSPPAFVQATFYDAAIRLPWNLWRPSLATVAEALLVLQSASRTPQTPPQLYRFFAHVALTVDWRWYLLGGGGGKADETAGGHLLGMLLQWLLLVVHNLPLPVSQELAAAVTGFSDATDWRPVGADAVLATFNEFLRSFAPLGQQQQVDPAQVLARWYCVTHVAASACGLQMNEAAGGAVTISPWCTAERLAALSKFHVMVQGSWPMGVPQVTGAIVQGAHLLAMRDGGQAFGPPVQILFGLYNAGEAAAASIGETMLGLARAQPAAAVLLAAIACRTIASSRKLVPALEGFLDAHFSSSRDWQIAVDAVSIPQIDESEFLTLSLDGGAFLVLYVYAQKRLLSERSSADILPWLARAKISPGREHLFVLLVAAYLEITASAALSSTTLAATLGRREALSRLVALLQHLGEDKQSGGIAGFFGMGKASPFSPAFRLCARAIAAFVLAQVPDDTNVVRVKAGDVHRGIAASIEKQMGAVAAAARSKESTTLLGPAADAVLRTTREFVSAPGHTIVSSRLFIGQIVSILWPNNGALAILQQAPGRPPK